MKPITHRLILLGSAASFLFFLSPAQGATRTWDGGSGVNDDFSQAPNWVGDVAAVSNDDLVFSGSVRLGAWSNYGSFTDFSTITFSAGAGAFIVRGNPIGINGAITNNSTTLQTIGAGNDNALRTNVSVNAANGDITFDNSNVYMDISTLNLTTSAGKTITFSANTNLRNGGGQGTAGVVAGGSGIVIFNRNAGYNGGTTVNGGTVRFVNSKTGDAGGGANSNNYTIGAAGTLEFNVTGANVVTLDNYGGGTISGTGTFNKTGTGTLLLGGPVGGNIQVALSAGGQINVQGGVLRNEYGRENWTNNFASLNVSSGAVVETWDGIGGITVDALTGSGTVQHTNYNTNGSQVTANLNVGRANGSGTFAGILRDEDGGGGGGQHFLALIKNGTGTQTLTGSNTYRGVTTVNAGTLIVNGNQSAANGAVTVAVSGTLGGSGTIGGATTVNGTLTPGNSPGLLTFNSGLSLGATANAIFEINGITEGVTYDSVDVIGNLAYGGTLTIDFGFAPVVNSTYNLFDFTGSQSGSFSVVFLDSGYNGTFDNASGVLTVTAVPEPGTVALVSLGLSLVFLRRRRDQH